MDLHRHDEASTFDGYGKPEELAKIAKELGHIALGISNHGNTASLVKHYLACREAGIKPVMGVEGYFLPVYKEQHRGYHLCLFAKNFEGYRNINTLQYEGEKQKYFNPIWTFELLRKHHEGIIATSACVAGFPAQCIKAGKRSLAVKYCKEMKSIFGNDFYIEIQPYKVSEEGLQELVNVEMLSIGKELNISCILTSDSHRGRKEEMDTYLKMHEIAGHDVAKIEETYSERYMPSDDELVERFVKMHSENYGAEPARDIALICMDNLKRLEESVEDDILEKLELKLPRFAEDPIAELKGKVEANLRKRGKWNTEYRSRILEELDVVEALGFGDYFLIVADYVNWAKEHGIAVGPGRGSACNCLLAYALGITEVDSLAFDLDFRRFLRKDKKKMPDIDLDFETERRDEAIRYLLNKYPGKTARVASYGLYRVDNLINDLAKVCGLPTDVSVRDSVAKGNAAIIREIKKFCKGYVDEGGTLDSETMKRSPKYASYNKKHDNILLHFTRLYNKIRYFGTHAAGVVVTDGNILDYTALKITDGEVYTVYDLNDVDSVHMVKFDLLGLGTMGEIGELRKVSGTKPDYDSLVKDEKVFERFREGDTQGIFQFDARSVREMLVNVDCDSFKDLVAVNAMNRPGPLQSKMPDAYVTNKFDETEAKSSPWYEYTKDTYGTMIYQEQIQRICVYVGGMEWSDADKVMKMDVAKANAANSKANAEKNVLMEKFVSGAVKNGLSEGEARSVFEAMMVYSFNKGHATGYSLIPMEEMWYRVYYPTLFWYCKIKYAPNEDMHDSLCALAVKSGAVVFLPHINYSEERTRLRKVDGEYAIQQGLREMKGIGEKAAETIVAERKKRGVFTSWDDFYDRCKGRAVTERTLKLLKENGATEFRKNVYLRRVVMYNSSLLARAGR